MRNILSGIKTCVILLLVFVLFYIIAALAPSEDSY